jgi:hypothetical protein
MVGLLKALRISAPLLFTLSTVAQMHICRYITFKCKLDDIIPAVNEKQVEQEIADNVEVQSGIGIDEVGT